MSSVSHPAVKYAVACLCGCLAFADVHAADTAGSVKTVKGAVHIERAGKSTGVAVGSEVQGRDRIVTGADSSVGITLRDNTQLSAGANSVLDLNKFVFDTTTHDGALDATVRRGSLAVIPETGEGQSQRRAVQYPYHHAGRARHRIHHRSRR